MNPLPIGLVIGVKFPVFMYYPLNKDVSNFGSSTSYYMVVSRDDFYF